MKNLFFSVVMLFVTLTVSGQKVTHNGINNNLSNLFLISDAESYSISAENRTGLKGKGGMALTGTHESAARDLGQGWKVSPALNIKGDTTIVLADIQGSGAIQHIWCTPTDKRNWRNLILRVYYDNEETPSVEVPLGDFFCSGWGESTQVNSLAVTVSPKNGFNCYWIMPFKKGCKVTVENLNPREIMLFYQIDYVLSDVPENAAYLHAQFRRSNPHNGEEADFTILDNIKGKGHFVGMYMAWGSNNKGWWGEGEVKFFIDGDGKFPTICGTGTEDYFCGAYCFVNKEGTAYEDYSTPYAGFHAFEPDQLWNSQMRFGMYRWHLTDPIRFKKDLRVTVQTLSWRKDGRYLPLKGDDISTTSFWYQMEPHGEFPQLPDRDELTVY